MEKHATYIIIFLVLGGGVLFFLTCENFEEIRMPPPEKELNKNFQQEVNSSENTEMEVVVGERGSISNALISYYAERTIQKPFGVFITPENSPITPERFRGYHTGVDFEIFEDEIDANVFVSAICDGVVRVAQRVDGYGGVVIHDCVIGGEKATVLYGHLDLRSIDFAVGSEVAHGDIIGVLGAHESAETDGERKHLHLGIHKGVVIDVRGYVDSVGELEDWIDPCRVIMCKN